MALIGGLVRYNSVFPPHHLRMCTIWHPICSPPSWYVTGVGEEAIGGWWEEKSFLVTIGVNFQESTHVPSGLVDPLLPFGLLPPKQ